MSASFPRISRLLTPAQRGEKEFMEPQRTPRGLSSRVIGSAKGLASSTFSGVASVEAELRDLRVLGKQSTRILAVRGTPFRPNIEDYASQKARVSPRRSSPSFRNFVSASRDESARSDADVEVFLNESDQRFHLDQRSADEDMEVRSQPVVGHANHCAKRRRTRVNQDPYGGDGFVWDDSDSFDREAVEDVFVGEEQQADDLCSESVDRDIVEQSPETRSIAVQRLDQLQRHLASCSLHTSQRHELRMGEMLHWQQPRQTWWREMQNFQRDARHYSNPSLQSEQRIAPDFQEPAQQQAEPEEEESRCFHCPYIACHHNLLQQNLSLPDTAQQRECIHTGCSYRSNTAREWLAHIRTAHHDLQGWPMLGFVDESLHFRPVL